MSAERSRSIPPVLRSEQHLVETGVPVRPFGALAPVALPISSEGVTFDMAQAAGWVDFDHFAVGRWDGSLTVFRFSESKTKGPLIAVAASTPSSEGVQMITWIGERVFATSNDDTSIAVWTPNEKWNHLECVSRLEHDPAFGAANSGDTLTIDTDVYLVAGHANGFATVWCGGQAGRDLHFVSSVDLRNDTPSNPWGIHNIRGVAAVELQGFEPCVITGSEDGDLCVVSVPGARILSRTRYNPKAQRGINAIALHGRDLLAANCSVGPEDSNLWLYSIDPADWTITARDSGSLKINPDAAQVFNFAVIWAEYSEGRCFFASTQEGALWMGMADAGRLSVLGYQQVTAPLGAALAWANNGNLAFCAYDLYEFNTQPKSASAHANPHRLS